MKDQLTRINEFVDSLEETSLNEDQQSILLNVDEVLGGDAVTNDHKCTNAIKDCEYSTNGSKCVNVKKYCGSNTKKCPKK